MTHVITGATGFVGSAIVAELLLRTDDDIVGVVRPKPGLTPTERLHGVLQPLVDGYRLPESMNEAITTRVRAVAGDLEQPGCGVEDALPVGAEFWHCAASLQYQDRHREVIERSNIAGTRHAIDAARAIGCHRFNMVSTAYVAGARSGLIEPIPGDADLLNNLYERSKVAAEQIVRSSGLRHRILRPGVVIGHSETRHTTSSDGFYGFLRSLRKFRSVLDRTQPGLADRHRATIVADDEGTLDLVPVDHVAADAVALSLADAPEGHYHLTNDTGPTIASAIRTCFDLAGLQPPILVGDAAGLGSMDTKLKERLDFYNSYLVNPKRFDRSSVREVLGDRASSGLLLDDDTLAEFGSWYLEAFESKRARLPVAR